MTIMILQSLPKKNSVKIVQIVPFKKMSYYVSNYILPIESYSYDELYDAIDKNVNFLKNIKTNIINKIINKLMLRI